MMDCLHSNELLRYRLAAYRIALIYFSYYVYLHLISIWMGNCNKLNRIWWDFFSACPFRSLFLAALNHFIRISELLSIICALNSQLTHSNIYQRYILQMYANVIKGISSRNTISSCSLYQFALNFFSHWDLRCIIHFQSVVNIGYGNWVIHLAWNSKRSNCARIHVPPSEMINRNLGSICPVSVNVDNFPMVSNGVK